MANLIPFESNAALPAHLAALLPLEKLGGESSGFPSISIKGKTFTMVRGDDRQLITRPGEDSPAPAIEVVILKQNPNVSKTYYASAYVEGSDAKPTCYSNNGTSPEPDAEAPQSSKCAICPHNQWGSRPSENGSKGKACGDFRRIAIAPLGMLNDPMLLRVPATSLKALDTYGDFLSKKGLPYNAVVTKIGFDFSVAYQALTFAGKGVLDEQSIMTVVESLTNPTIDRIIAATIPMPVEVPVVAAPKPTPVQAPAPPIQAPVAQQPDPTPAPVAVSTNAFFGGAPETEATPAPVAPQAAPAKKAAMVVEVSSSLEADLNSALAGMDFDDEA